MSNSAWKPKSKGLGRIYLNPEFRHAIVDNKGLGRVMSRFLFEGIPFESLEDAQSHAERFGRRAQEGAD